MLHCFYIYHLCLIKVGLTTNEAAKQSSLLSYLRKAAGFYERWLSKVDKDGNWTEKPSVESCKYYGCNGNESKQEVQKMLNQIHDDIKKLRTNAAYKQASFFEALKTVYNS